MKKEWLVKTLAMGIVVLFIGAGVVPSITGNRRISTKERDEIIRRRPELRIVKSDSSAYYLCSQRGDINLKFAYNNVSCLESNFTFEGFHPAIGRTESGVHMTAFRNENIKEVIWTFSVNDGESYDSGIYYDIGGDYPSIKQWYTNRFFGTFVTDPTDGNGGKTYLFECMDPTDNDTYMMWWYSWNNLGWHDMIDADIACDSSQNSWEWGISTFVMSTTYGNGYINGPTITYAFEDIQDGGWINYYLEDNCAHTDIVIDPVTHIAYAVYDQDKNLTDDWRLLCRVKDFGNVEDGFDELFNLTSDGNLQCPAVSAYNDNLVILAETDINGNKDIVCFYSNDGINNLQASVIASESDDEVFPDVRHVENSTFICTFVRSGEIYGSKTVNGGASWTAPWLISNITGPVVEEYKTSDLCEKAVKVMWEVEEGDIYIGDAREPSNYPPYNPSDPGPEDGATIVYVDADLSWNCSDHEGNLLIYDVYFEAEDPTPDVLLSDDQSETTYDPGTLNYATTYYWQIIVNDSYGAITEGPIWSFTTPMSDLDCRGSLSWSGVKPGSTVSGNINVSNIGESLSLLDWEIIKWPSWGNWVFTPTSGNNLKPSDGAVTINVSIKAPYKINKEFAGEVKIVNKENTSDNCTILVYLKTPKNKPFSFNFNLLSWFFELFSNAFPILRYVVRGR